MRKKERKGGEMVGGYVHRWVGGSVFLKKDRKKEREVRNKERKGGEK